MIPLTGDPVFVPEMNLPTASCGVLRRRQIESPAPREAAAGDRIFGSVPRHDGENRIYSRWHSLQPVGPVLGSFSLKTAPDISIFFRSILIFL
jgi:hypothetical protein